MRVADFILSAVGLVLTAPIILLAVIVIRLDSRGKPIFAQQRVGRQRKLFTCYKLRTMRSDTPEGASHDIGTASVTRVGRFLRRTKLDELPQLWNVLRGDMSLVGPRPCLSTQYPLISARERYGLYAIRPGITGPSQIAGVDMSDPERLAAYDATWLGSASLGTYFRILLLTVIGRGSGDAATGAADLP